MTDIRVISAKVPPEMVDMMDEMRNALNIETRNELIIRAIRLYHAAYLHGLYSFNKDIEGE
jgi:hypothetical protein